MSVTNWCEGDYYMGEEALNLPKLKEYREFRDPELWYLEKQKEKEMKLKALSEAIDSWQKNLSMFED